jgi:polyisoprenyl-phosphate glycosyltransferase
MPETEIPELSIVLPVFNEQDNLAELYRRLTSVLTDQLKLSHYELVFVDDFSKDNSWELINQLHSKDKRVKGLKFSRNFGHHVALSAGIQAAKGKAVVIMDSDLQDQPEEIPKLYRKFQEGFDVVYGIRARKNHSFLKRFTADLFVNVMNSISEVKINSHVFRIMSRRIVDVVNQFKERDRFLLGLISYAGFKEIGIEVEHGVRFAGQTKYSWRKMMRLALNSITSFSIRPLQLASWCGFVLAFFGFVAIIALSIMKIFFNIGVMGWPSIMVAIIFIGGIQMIFLGLLGEYIGRIFLEVKQRPLFVVEKQLS